MKYKGNKALMKCCKSCTDKRGIKCLGNQQIKKFEGYKFCAGYNPMVSMVSARIMSLIHKVNFHKKINYYGDEVAVTKAVEEAEALAPEAKQVATDVSSVLIRAFKNLVRMVNNLGKGKNTNKKEAY